MAAEPERGQESIADRHNLAFSPSSRPSQRSIQNANSHLESLLHNLNGLGLGGGDLALLAATLLEGSRFDYVSTSSHLKIQDLPFTIQNCVIQLEDSFVFVENLRLELLHVHVSRLFVH